MSTRSEIRFYKNKKLKDCIYHHQDGYPSHIVNDLNGLTNENGKRMSLMAKEHGTQDTICWRPKSSTILAEDIEYAYDVHLNNQNFIEKVEIFNARSGRKANKIFDGTIKDAVKKFLFR